MASLDPTGYRQDHSPRESALDLHRKRSGGHSLHIPDLRFEQSYLRSLEPFIHDPADLDAEGHKSLRHEGGFEKEKSVRIDEQAAGINAATSGPYGVPLRFEWGRILYITTRDQILSPFAQGAVWALASHFFRPFLRSLGAWVRIHFWQSWRSIFPPVEPRIHDSFNWMQDQLRGFTAGDLRANSALPK